jgi:uncharacterized protein YggE
MKCGKVGRLNLALLLLLGVALSSSAAGPLPEASHIYVEGSGEVVYSAASAAITVEYERESRDVDSANSQLAKALDALLGSLVEAGVSRADVESSSALVQPDFDMLRGEMVAAGSTVSRLVRITVRDLARYGAVSSAIFRSDPTRIRSVVVYGKNDREEELNAQQLALKDARERAERIAASIGARITRAHSVSEFDLRRREEYDLSPMRNSSSAIDSEEENGANMASPPSRAEMLSMPLSPQTMRAHATVFVVFLTVPVDAQ